MAASGENARWLHANLPGRGSSGAQERPGLERGGEIPPYSWRKSSYSAYNGSCVEVARLGGTGSGTGIGVRDTKNSGAGPVLVFGARAWDAFLSGVKNGEFPIAP